MAHNPAVRERDDRLEVQDEEVILERPAQAFEESIATQPLDFLTMDMIRRDHFDGAAGSPAREAP